MSFASLLRGDPHIDDVVLTQPVLHTVLHRERTRRSDGAPQRHRGRHSGGTTDALLRVSHVTVDNGTMIMADKRRGVEHRFEKVALDASIGADRNVRVIINALTRGGHPVGLETNAAVPAGALSGLMIPVDFKLKAPALLTQQLAATATVKLNGKTLQIDALKGDLDGAEFTGTAAVDFDGKPQVTLNLGLTKIGLVAPWDTASAPDGQSSQSDAPRPWSDKPFDSARPELCRRTGAPLDRRNRHRRAENRAARGRRQPGRAASCAGPHRRSASMKVWRLRASPWMRSANTPSFALRAELRQVHALPLLSSAADFTRLDGKLDATVNVQATGSSQRDIVGSLSGIAVTKFQDGESAASMSPR